MQELPPPVWTLSAVNRLIEVYPDLVGKVLKDIENGRLLINELPDPIEERQQIHLVPEDKGKSIARNATIRRDGTKTFTIRVPYHIGACQIAIAIAWLLLMETNSSGSDAEEREEFLSKLTRSQVEAELRFRLISSGDDWFAGFSWDKNFNNEFCSSIKQWCEASAFVLFPELVVDKEPIS
jgi:hypothetical protein